MNRTSFILLIILATCCAGSTTASAFYNPSVGRWMNRDPKGEAGGDNLYGFVKNNPASLVDPDGHSPVAIGVAGYILWDLTCFTIATARASLIYPSDDKKKHCMTSCVYNRCKFLLTPEETAVGGALWELVMPGTAEWKDFVADLYGVLSSYNIFQSCRNSCDKCPVK